MVFRDLLASQNLLGRSWGVACRSQSEESNLSLWVVQIEVAFQFFIVVNRLTIHASNRGGFLAILFFYVVKSLTLHGSRPDGASCRSQSGESNPSLWVVQNTVAI
jgi:hypothetical protein